MWSQLYMDNLFSSSDLFYDLMQKSRNCCGTVSPNRKGMPQNIRPKKMKQMGWKSIKTRSDLMAILWRNKWVSHRFNIHNAPEEGNFCDEQGNPTELLIVADYNHHMVYVDKRDKMANSYSISCRTWWDRETVLPSVRSGHSEQLHSAFFICWEENFIQRFSNLPREECAGTYWQARRVHKEAN